VSACLKGANGGNTPVANGVSRNVILCDMGGAAAHRQLQALLLGRGERGLRELNNVGFGVAPTARAWQRGGRVEASTRRTPRGRRGTLEHHGSMQSFDHSGIQTLNFGCGENCQYETAASQWLACSNSSSSNRRTHGVYATG
jgi:hypothetical protein